MYYNMKHLRRGMAIVFNHENFTVSDLKSRAGTQTDCECFTERLKHLGFDVDVYNDLGYQDLVRVIEKGNLTKQSDNVNTDNSYNY